MSDEKTEESEWEGDRAEKDKETDLRSTSISLERIFFLQRNPLCCCTLYWMLWKLTVEPHRCFFPSTPVPTFDTAIPLVPMSSIIAMLMWLVFSIILCCNQNTEFYTWKRNAVTLLKAQTDQYGDKDRFEVVLRFPPLEYLLHANHFLKQ